jgi:hypothetical protein
MMQRQEDGERRFGVAIETCLMEMCVQGELAAWFVDHDNTRRA